MAKQLTVRKHQTGILLTILAFGLHTTGQTHRTEYSGKIIDMHVLLFVEEGDNISAERTNTIGDIVAFMPKDKIEKAAIITIAQKGNMADTRMRNDSIIAASRRQSPLIPVCSVHPMDGADALAEMQRVHDLGVQVIKLHPNSQRFDVSAPEVDAVAKKAGELKMIMLFDSYSPTDAGEIGKLVMLAATNPDARFIFAHTGLVNFPQLLMIEGLKKYPWFRNNIWFDLSAIAPILGNSPFHDQLMWTIRKIGVGQFMFGSDFPLFDPAESIKAVHAMGFSADEEQKIFYGNACRLLGIRH